MSWGVLVGGAVGLIVGLLTKHWIAWSVALGAIGFIVGAFLDRRRR